MPENCGRAISSVFHPRLRRSAAFVLVVLPFLGGCSQYVTEGNISDRETGSAIPDVEILNSRGDEWKRIARTDSSGKYFIFKYDVKGGGSIRFKKPGYFVVTMPDSEFLGVSSHLMIPTGRGSTPEDADAGAAMKEADRMR